MFRLIFLILIVFITTIIITVYGHGRLMEPAGRATLWRFKEFKRFNPVEDYNDNEAYCGGFKVQYLQNNGKCGVCGDGNVQLKQF